MGKCSEAKTIVIASAGKERLMRTVFKYPLELRDGPQSLSVPKFAEVVLVAVQHGKICVWMQIDDHIPPETRRFVVYGTGRNVKGRHCGSVVIEPFVWHVYEVD
jgi:hypothetical protein